MAPKKTHHKPGPAARFRKASKQRSASKKVTRKTGDRLLKKIGTDQAAKSMKDLTPQTEPLRVRFKNGPVVVYRRQVTYPVLLFTAYYFISSGVHQSLSSTWWLAAIPIGLGVRWSRKVDPRDAAQWTWDDVLQRKAALRERPKQENRTWWSSPSRVSAAGLGALASVLMLVPSLTIGRISVTLIWELLILLLVIEIRFRRFAARPAEEPAVDEPIKVWAQNIGRVAQPAQYMDALKDGKKVKVLTSPAVEAGKLPGSYLTSFERLNKASWKATVVGVRGKQGTTEVRNAVEAIAGIYGINPDWVEVQATNDHSQPTLIVTEQATLARSKPWKFTGIENGTVQMGTFPDGSRSRVTLFVQGQGIRHIWFTGGTGGGKTGSVNVFLGQAMRSALIVLDLVDLGSTSLPAWSKKAFRFGTSVEEGVLALRRANAVMYMRMKAMQSMVFTERDGTQQVGVSTLRQTLEWPIYMLLIEEWPKLLTNKEAIHLANEIGRLGRKYGVMLVIVSQGSSLDTTFKGAELLRTNIQQGNVVALRADKEAGPMAMGGALTVNLGRIPMGVPGMGFVLSPANMRDSLSRMDWVDDDEDRPDDVPSSWEMSSKAVMGTPNPHDLFAVETVEAEFEAAKAAKEAKSDIPLHAVPDVPQEYQNLTVAEKVALELMGPQLLGEARLGDIAAKSARLLNIDTTNEDAYKRHYDRTRKQLEASAMVEKSGHGKYIAAGRAA